MYQICGHIREYQRVDGVANGVPVASAHHPDVGDFVVLLRPDKGLARSLLFSLSGAGHDVPDDGLRRRDECDFEAVLQNALSEGTTQTDHRP